MNLKYIFSGIPTPMKKLWWYKWISCLESNGKGGKSCQNPENAYCIVCFNILLFKKKCLWKKVFFTTNTIALLNGPHMHTLTGRPRTNLAARLSMLAVMVKAV